MITIGIISQKGGSGKTTLAVHLAEASDGSGNASVIVDTDPQATATRWGKWRQGKDPDVIDCASHALLGDKLAALEKAGAQVVVIDTPPNADIMAREACRASDLILIPCRPRAFDLDAVRATADLAKASGKPAFVVFMAGPPNAPLLYAEAGDVVQKLGLTVAPFMLPERAAFHRAVGEGKAAPEIEPKGKAAADVANLCQWVVSVISGKPDTKKRKRK